MSENSTLRIHTQLPPDAPAKPVVVTRRARKKNRLCTDDCKRCDASSGASGYLPLKVKASYTHSSPSKGFPLRGNRLAEGQTDEVDTTAYRDESKKKQRKEKNPAAAQAMPRRRGGFSDRLLRNSAIACAVLLGVLALGNIRQPWAQKAREGIERALTMRIDLDDSLGELTFVRSLMPESALVFLNVSGGAAMARPTDGAVTHPWSALQPWTIFEANGGMVCAAGAGTVTAVSPLSDGRFGVLIDHGEGVESVYAALDEVSVAGGDAVGRGDALGTCAGGLYFEVREGGESIDPAERLGL